MNAEIRTATQKPTPYERKLARLQDAAATALQHAREDAEASEEAALRLVAKRDRLLAELDQVRADLAAVDVRRQTAVAALGEAQRHLTTREAAVSKAGEPFDRHIAALKADVESYDYRISQHVGRGPGSTALFIGVKR